MLLLNKFFISIFFFFLFIFLLSCLTYSFALLSMKHYFSFFIPTIAAGKQRYHTRRSNSSKNYSNDNYNNNYNTPKTHLFHNYLTFYIYFLQSGKILEFDGVAIPTTMKSTTMMLKPLNDDESTEIFKTPDGEAVNSIFTNTPFTFDDHHRSKSNIFDRSTSNFIK